MRLKEFLEGHLPHPNASGSLSQEDLERFFWKYKGLLKERERSNAFWSSTNDNLKTAYETLDEKERQLQKAYDLNRKYLDNINEGLIIIDSEFVILDQYSQYLEELFNTNDVAGTNLIDFLFPAKEGHEEDRKALEKFLEILFKNTITDIDMIKEVNPLVNKVILVFDSNGTPVEKTMSANFTRIFEGDEVANIMIIFEDITDIVMMEKKLEHEKNRHQAETESISAILKAGPRAFMDFINEAKGALALFEDSKERIHDVEVINKLFREMHSLKASARYLALGHLSARANRIEDKLAVIKKNPKSITKGAFDEIISLTNELFKDFKYIETLTDKIQDFSKFFVRDKGAGAHTSFDDFLSSLQEMTESISGELEKKVDLVINNELDEFPLLDQVKSPIIHLLRNSIDHGIEDTYERMTTHKEDTGTIQVSFSKEDRAYIVEITDDGRGINFKKIKEKAIEKELLKKNDFTVTNSTLLNLIFTPSFSSRDDISEISGRGYGLDVVKDTIKRLHGKILVSTKEHKGTKITLRIPQNNDDTPVISQAI